MASDQDQNALPSSWRCGRSPRATPSISSAIRIAGKGELDVGDAHDHGVDARRRHSRRSRPSVTPSAIANSTEADADQQRDARAVHDRREDVAALVVGAERKAAVAARLPGRRLEGIEQVQRLQIEGIVRRDERRQKRRSDHHHASVPRRRRPSWSAGSCAADRCREKPPSGCSARYPCWRWPAAAERLGMARLFGYVLHRPHALRPKMRMRGSTRT